MVFSYAEAAKFHGLEAAASSLGAEKTNSLHQIRSFGEVGLRSLSQAVRSDPDRTVVGSGYFISIR
jgi:hypothetical protein